VFQQGEIDSVGDRVALTQNPGDFARLPVDDTRQDQVQAAAGGRGVPIDQFEDFVGGALVEAIVAMLEKLDFRSGTECPRLHVKATFRNQPAQCAVCYPMKVIALEHHLELAAVKDALRILLEVSEKPRAGLIFFTVFGLFDSAPSVNRLYQT
jgi:hypothetical protein